MARPDEPTAYGPEAMVGARICRHIEESINKVLIFTAMSKNYDNCGRPD
jgi:hypothetical protein